jgi:hypothetical protein
LLGTGSIVHKYLGPSGPLGSIPSVGVYQIRTIYKGLVSRKEIPLNEAFGMKFFDIYREVLGILIALEKIREVIKGKGL